MSEQIKNGTCIECGALEGNEHLYNPVCEWHKSHPYVCDACWLNQKNGHSCPMENQIKLRTKAIKSAFTRLKEAQTIFSEWI